MSCVQLFCTSALSRGRAAPHRTASSSPFTFYLVPHIHLASSTPLLPNLTHLSSLSLPFHPSSSPSPHHDSSQASLYHAPPRAFIHSSSPHRAAASAMAGANRLAALLLLLLALAVAASASSIAAGDHMHLGLLAGHGKKVCSGTVGECGFGDDEMGDAEGELGSADGEAHRRFLQGGNGYISYGALRRGTVPCNRRGASYYNCRAGAQANPYRRGCSRITRCRG